MSKKSLVLLLLLAILPLAAVAWLGWRVARVESLRVRSQYQLVLEERLAEYNRTIQQYFARLQRSLSSQIDGCGDSATAIRELVRQSPQVRQVVVLNRRGDVVHPRMDLNDGEREFLGEIAEMIRDKDLVRLAFQTDSEPQPSGAPPSVAAGESSQQGSTDPSKAQIVFTWSATTGDAGADAAPKSADSTNTPAPSSARRLQAVPGNADGVVEGWFTWYWGRGVNLMYWRRWHDDRLTVIALPRARWMADLLAVLPETKQPADAAVKAAQQCIRLVDSSDQVVYQWGRLAPAATTPPTVELPLAPPLAAWRFKYYVDRSASSAAASRLPLAAGLAGMACGLLGLVIVLYREYSRDMREAMQRVNFVNQVSHELKTPLTNIRLYADLLERDLEQLSDANLEKPRSRLNVISSESQRLSRLITHVLTFARAERDQLSVQARLVDLDELVEEVVDRFRPALEAEHMEVDVSTEVGEQVRLDPDMVEQILGNLISNAQRYAADGRHLSVRAFCEGERAIVEVADRGPGVGAKLARRIFQPFARGARGLSDATGTGIGLSIARRLARLQGGDLSWVPSAQGATFRLILSREHHHESVAGRG